MKTSQKQQEVSEHRLGKNSPDKWLRAYELIYACACALCKFVPSIVKGVNANVFMGALSVISMILIIITAATRVIPAKRGEQHEYAVNVCFFALITAMIFKWCLEGEF